MAMTATGRQWPPGTKLRAVLRHEKLRLGTEPPPLAANRFRAEIVLRAFAGAQCRYVVRLPSGLELQADAPAGPGLTEGAHVTAWWPPEDIILLAPAAPDA